MSLAKSVLGCAVLATVLMTGARSAAAQPDPATLSGVIERFIVKQFPQAHGHFWVVNGTEWGAADEVIVDVNAIVRNADREPTEERFLLLVVAGELVATQSIPLGAKVLCTPQKETA